MLRLTLCLQGPCLQLCPTVRAPDSFLLPRLIVKDLPCHLVGVYLLQLYGPGPALLAYHSSHLLYVVTQAYPIKKSHQDVQVLLQPGQTQVDEYPIICIEKCGQIFTALLNPSGTAKFLAITVAQWWVTVPTNIFYMVWNRRSPCVTPLETLNRVPQ